MVYFLLSSDNALYIAIARLLYRVIATKTLVFAPNTKNRSVVSVYRIHSKNSKVVNYPKNHPISTHRVVTNPKYTHKNIYKVVTTHQTSNTIPSSNMSVAQRRITVRITQTK